MNKKLGTLFVLGLIALLMTVGCGTTPTPAPLPTPPPVYITVIVTATPLPATETPAQPTITPIPTLPLTATVAVATPVAAKPTVAGAAKPSATRKPTVAAATITPTPFTPTRPAPKLIGPDFNPDTGRKDERHSPADALIFEWESIGPLGPNECYQIRVDFQPGAGDVFLQCDPGETQKGQSQTTRFILNQPNRAGPNYGGLLPDPPAEVWVNWFVTIVRDDGIGPDGAHHKTTPLSAKSSTYRFLLRGGP